MNGRNKTMSNKEFTNLTDIPDSADTKVNIYQKKESKDIAVIGIALKIASYGTWREYIKCLNSQKSPINEINENRKQDIKDYFTSINIDKEKVKWKQACFMDNIDKFDNTIFGISPKEAAYMDPNQRIMLQTVYEAIEDSGRSIEKVSGANISLFIGYEEKNEYQELIEKLDPDMLSFALPGNISSAIAGRISYTLNLKGNSMVINSSDSSSLTAVHLACKSLINNEANMAVAGGIDLNIFPFDYNDFLLPVVNNGMGECAAALLLKPLTSAIEDNDHIYGVIKSCLLNQNGKGTVEMKKCILKKILSNENTEMIDLIEMTGNNSKKEIDLVKSFFNQNASNECFMVSDIINEPIGKLNVTSGIFGLVRSMLLISNKKNRDTALNNQALIIHFGESGDNACILLEGYDNEVNNNADNEYKVLTLSDSTPERLKELIKRYYLFDYSTGNIDNICYTVNTGRNKYKYCIAIIFKTLNELKRSLKSLLDENLTTDNDKIFCSDLSIEKNSSIDNEKRGVEKVLINKYVSESVTDLADLREICTYYVNGVHIDWDIFYSHRKMYKVSVPYHLHADKRCWINKKKESD